MEDSNPRARSIKDVASVINLLKVTTQLPDYIFNSRISDMPNDRTNQPVIGYVEDLMVLSTLLTDEENLSPVF